MLFGTFAVAVVVPRKQIAREGKKIKDIYFTILLYTFVVRGAGAAGRSAYQFSRIPFRQPARVPPYCITPNRRRNLCVYEKYFQRFVYCARMKEKKKINKYDRFTRHSHSTTNGVCKAHHNIAIIVYWVSRPLGRDLIRTVFFFKVFSTGFIVFS